MFLKKNEPYPLCMKPKGMAKGYAEVFNNILHNPSFHIRGGGEFKVILYLAYFEMKLGREIQLVLKIYTPGGYDNQNFFIYIEVKQENID